MTDPRQNAFNLLHLLTQSKIRGVFNHMNNKIVVMNKVKVFNNLDKMVKSKEFSHYRNAFAKISALAKSKDIIFT